MPRFADGATITVSSDGDDHTLTTGGDGVGRIRGSELEVGGLTVVHRHSGESRELVAGGRRRVLRLDPHGGKATWLTLSRSRYRLARQRTGVPLLHRWVLTRDVEGPAVLTVSQAPLLGTRVDVADAAGTTDEELDALIAGSLAVVLEVPAEEPVGA